MASGSRLGFEAASATERQGHGGAGAGVGECQCGIQRTEPGGGEMHREAVQSVGVADGSIVHAELIGIGAGDGGGQAHQWHCAVRIEVQRLVQGLAQQSRRKGAARPDEDGRETSIGDGGHTIHAVRRSGRFGDRVVAPHHHGAIVLERHGPVVGGNGNHSAETFRHFGHTWGLASPLRDRPIGFQRQGMAASIGDGDHVMEAGGHLGLAVVVASPGGDGAVAAEGK